MLHIVVKEILESKLGICQDRSYFKSV